MNRPLTIECAEIRIEVDFDPSASLARQIIHVLYGPFLREAALPGTADLRVSVKAVAGVPFIDPAGQSQWVIRTGERGQIRTFESFHESGWMDLARGKAELEIRPAGRIENFLRVAFAWLCADRGRVLLHSAGLVRNGSGFAFFGRSGAGKSTIATLSSQVATILSDDLTVIGLRFGRPWLFGVPFRGDSPEFPRVSLDAPLHGLFCLTQSFEHGVQPLASAEAVSRLVTASPFLVGHPRSLRAALATCANIISRLAVRELRFRKDPGFWEVIDADREAFTPSSSRGSGH